MLLSEMQSRDVVNVVDGSKVGRIKDIDVDIVNGNVISLTILTVSKVRSFFRGGEVIVIPWERVVKMGGEVTIINYNANI